MAEQKSIFDLADKFGYESPFVDWLPKQQLEISKKSNNDLVKLDSITNRRPTNKIIPQTQNTRLGEAQKAMEAVFWKLGGEKDAPHETFYLRDENGIIQTFSKEDNKYEQYLYGKPIKLCKGTRVVVLDTIQLGLKYYNRVILFWKGQYREGYVTKSAFVTNFLGYDNNSKYLFINDVERLLFEFEVRIEQDISAYPLVKSAYNFVKENISNVKKIDSFQFEKIVRNYYKSEDTDLDFSRLDSVEKASKFLDSKFKNYIKENKILILPITGGWFKRAILKEGQDSEFAKFVEKITPSGLKSDFDRDTGNMKSPNIFSSDVSTDNVEGVVPLLEELFHIVKRSTYLRNTLEGVWLRKNIHRIQGLNFGKDSKRKGNLLILGEATWLLGRWSNYSSFIGIQNSFGPVYCTPLYTVILHELDQGNLNYLPGDSHAEPSESFEVIKEIRTKEKSYFIDKLIRQGRNSNHYASDLVYQSNIYHGLVFIEIFLKKYT